MFRKHFRFRRMILGLAFAPFAVPVAPAGAASLSTYIDGGRALVSITPVTSHQPSYLRYHEVGAPVATGAEIRSENAAATSTVTGLQADGLRYTAMAQRYEQLRLAGRGHRRLDRLRGGAAAGHRHRPHTPKSGHGSHERLAPGAWIQEAAPVSGPPLFLAE